MKLKILRKRSKLAWKEIESKSGLKRQTIDSAERGKSDPGVETLERILLAYSSSLLEFFSSPVVSFRDDLRPEERDALERCLYILRSGHPHHPSALVMNLYSFCYGIQHEEYDSIRKPTALKAAEIGPAYGNSQPGETSPANSGGRRGKKGAITA